MNNIAKNSIAFIVGIVISFTFLWLIGLGASVPVPEFMSQFTNFSVNYYSGLVTTVLSLTISSIIVLIARKVFKLESLQHVLFYVLPIIIYLIYLQVVASFAFVPFLYAAIPALLISITIVLGKKKT